MLKYVRYLTRLHLTSTSKMQRQETLSNESSSCSICRTKDVNENNCAIKCVYNGETFTIFKNYKNVIKNYTIFNNEHEPKWSAFYESTYCWPAFFA